MILELEVGDEIIVDRYVGRRYKEGEIWRFKVKHIILIESEKLDLHSGYDVDCTTEPIEIITDLLNHPSGHIISQPIVYANLKRLKGFWNIDYENRKKIGMWKEGLQ